MIYVVAVVNGLMVIVAALIGYLVGRLHERKYRR